MPHWENALNYCEGLELKGQTDWRLPNVKEIATIVDHRYSGVKVDSGVFTNSQSAMYWTSTTYNFNTSQAWILNLKGNVGILNVFLKNNPYPNINKTYVRCLRGGI